MSGSSRADESDPEIDMMTQMIPGAAELPSVAS